ncbi:MAG: DNA polymerase III subunit gamma/tau, partial [Acidimicrobiales bacterium]
MTDPAPTTEAVAGATALYRRFRPGRFADLRGQDHVVRALQGAVKNGRVVHAYLFSGPRGTGKTTAARVLAKALNCENPVDGDACDRCASCVAITRGSSLDVTELDAASNNGVDDIREITAGAWHQTPGRWKVYIFDEVHQLSKAASAALLKTLEEPPSHVVFVLATTDPHKVLPTIRSRTQHLDFRLFNGETLSALLHDVRSAADLAADDETLEAAVRLGRGSARDALSALDQLVATGSRRDAGPVFDGLLGALVDVDAVGALRALAHLTGEGWDPEQVAEDFAGEVRQVFLLQVAPEVADAVDRDRERLSAWGQRLGLARTVRILETLGRAMRDMKSSPEKIAVMEVALIRLVRPELDHDVAALDERL